MIFIIFELLAIAVVLLWKTASVSLKVKVKGFVEIFFAFYAQLVKRIDHAVLYMLHPPHDNKKLVSSKKKKKKYNKEDNKKRQILVRRLIKLMMILLVAAVILLLQIIPMCSRSSYHP